MSKDKPAGIECPKCGGTWFKVVYVRPQAKKTLRRKECQHCGRRVTTYEQLSCSKVTPV